MKRTASYVVFGLSALPLAIGCAGMGAKGGGSGAAMQMQKFDVAAYNAQRAEVTKSFTDVSNGGIMKESKKVLVPDFKVYFHVQARGAAQTGHALSGLGGGRKEARVSQKVNLALEPKVMQEITDGLYRDFTAELKQMGYEVVDAKSMAAEFPEFKKYWEGDSMKASPAAVGDEVAAYAPTGWKLEQPGVDIGMNQGGAALSAFGTTLNDINVRASEKLNAIRLSPVYVVGFSEIRSEGNVNRAELQVAQSVRVAPGTAIRWGKGYSFGHVKLDKGIASMEEFGKLANADTAGDKTRGVMSALGSALKFGGNSNESSTLLLEANPQKFKSIAQAQLKIANDMLFDRLKAETK